MTKVRYAPAARRITGRDRDDSVALATFADLIHRLGDIPAERILLAPPPGTATEEDLLQLLEGPKSRITELVDGVLVEKPVGAEEGLYGSWLSHLLWKFVEEHDLGVVLGEGSPTRFRVGLVRIPDVCFVPWERVPNEEFPSDRVSKIIPSLAIEVLSKSNTKREIQLKLDEYFEAGVKATWIISPKTRSAKIYTSRKRYQKISSAESLVGGKALPGFRLPLYEVFAVPRRRKRKPR
jgi:Uma2 family endonuclease